ncbi:MAG TPA: hypothetical protein VN455_11395 [Methanotrichaceae archaeon]|nr:hypothetical protein [Methanotrichaceae archaeon]
MILLNRGIDLAVTAALLISSIGLCVGDDVSSQSRYIYDSTQSVEGDGFANSYSLLSTDYLHLKNIAHGSGRCSQKSVVHSRQLTRYNISSAGFSNTSDSEIKLDQVTNATYSPESLIIGRSSRALSFASKWSEDTGIKNSGMGASMGESIDRATTMSNDISTRLYSYSDYWDTDEWVDWDDYGCILRTLSDSYVNESIQSASLKTGSDFTGAAKFYAVQAIDSPKTARLLIDENYLGTFSLTKNMVLSDRRFRNAHDEGWLPCCSGGWSAMDAHDRLGYGASAEGIFDCTCFKAPSSAQFQRDPKETANDPEALQASRTLPHWWTAQVAS